MVPAPLPQRFVLASPDSFLSLFRDGTPAHIDLDGVSVSQVWALVGLAAQARRNGAAAMTIDMGDTPVGRFARAIGLRDVVDGRDPGALGEEGRTYRLRRIIRLDEYEGAASDIARLMLPSEEDDESQKTIRYVLIELMRNAIQHSDDPKGGVVAAQRMDAGHHGYPRAVIQVAVADAGIGVLASLRTSHPDLDHAGAALVKSLEPHFSGAFGPGRTGTAQNAGMGLFFISEMAKRTAGRMLLASRGAALVVTGDDEGYGHQHLLPHGSYPGTLVAFELPIGEVRDHSRLIEVITEKAKERTPKRDTSPWVRFEAPPASTTSFLVTTVAEDVSAAERLSREQIQPRLFQRHAVGLDFRNITICTQSFAHALLYEAIRLSWAVQTPIYIENAQPAVATAIRLVDNYARGG